MRLHPLLSIAATLVLLTAACAHYDTVLRNGTIYDGSGAAPRVGDVAMRGDRIVAVGAVRGRGKHELDVRGLAVAPGFINMLSWATDSLIVDGRAMADVKQGVTTEIFGEGFSMGPLSDAMKKEITSHMSDIKYDIDWTTLREYLDSLVRRGISV
ncbi:MAG TPA: D-aminoacylase, partial [Thermoanaerobaculia bacterium]|nr:D-aminoacylase [Thermoanaerobaculia bacterium]